MIATTGQQIARAIRKAIDDLDNCEYAIIFTDRVTDKFVQFAFDPDREVGERRVEFDVAFNYLSLEEQERAIDFYADWGVTEMSDVVGQTFESEEKLLEHLNYEVQLYNSDDADAIAEYEKNRPHE